MDKFAASSLPGFDAPVDRSQQVFRAVLDAFAHPGRIVAVTGPAEVPVPLLPASAAVCLSLADFETPLWLDPAAQASGGAASYLRFHCGCPFTDGPAEAAFALIADPAAWPGFEAFRLGSDSHPEDGATVILQVPALRDDEGIRLSGPGIERQHRLHVDDLSETFWAERARLSELFPRGIDLVFASADRIAAIPRSTRVEV